MMAEMQQKFYAQQQQLMEQMQQQQQQKQTFNQQQQLLTQQNQQMQQPQQVMQMQQPQQVMQMQRTQPPARLQPAENPGYYTFETAQGAATYPAGLETVASTLETMAEDFHSALDSAETLQPGTSGGYAGAVKKAPADEEFPPLEQRGQGRRQRQTSTNRSSKRHKRTSSSEESKR